MVAPPVFDGGVHETTTSFGPAVAVTLLGGSGSPDGVTAFEGDDVAKVLALAAQSFFALPEIDAKPLAGRAKFGEKQ